MPCASTPRRFNAASTALPLLSDTSRSAEGPPINTATFPKSRGFLFIALTYHSHFGFQSHAMQILHRGLNFRNQAFDIRGGGLASVDDEVGVQFGNTSSAFASAFQSAGLNETRG